MHLLERSLLVALYGSYFVLHTFFFFGQKREEEFNQYLRDKLADAKGDFRQLLKETHSLTYK